MPIEALRNRSFLDAYNGPDGEATAAGYFAALQTFEHDMHPTNAGPEDLGRLLHFDATDLYANRAGLISPTQRTRLWHRDELQLAGAAICLLSGLAFNAALIAGWMTIRGRGAGLGLVLMLLGGLLGALSWTLWTDLAAGSVVSVEGDLTTDMTSSMRGGTSYYFAINGMRFGVPKQAFEQLHEGKRRLYYLKRSMTLLSVEPT